MKVFTGIRGSGKTKNAILEAYWDNADILVLANDAYVAYVFEMARCMKTPLDTQKCFRVNNELDLSGVDMLVVDEAGATLQKLLETFCGFKGKIVYMTVDTSDS